MSDLAEVIEQTEEKKPVVASVGKPIPMQRVAQEAVNQTEEVVEEQKVEVVELTDEQKTAAEEAAAPKATEEVATEQKPLTREEIKALYEKEFPTHVELTDEQKVAKENDYQKRLLDLYTEGGGTLEQFVAINNVLKMDLTELSKSELTAELKAKGFSDTDVQEVLVERYYQLNPDELEQNDDETDEEYNARKEKVKLKVGYGTERLTNHSANIKKNAEAILEGLKKGLSERDLQKQDEAEFIAKIDEVSKSLPRKLTVELGKLENEALGSVQMDIPESEITEIINLLKDPAQREQLLYTENGDLNIESISNLLLKNKMLERAAREALFEGQTREVRKFEKIFPYRNPQALGVGGSTSSPKTTGAGKVASFGKSQRVSANRPN